jgi:hypothetical protein
MYDIQIWKLIIVNFMKKIVSGFTIYPFGRGKSQDSQVLRDTASKKAELLGRPYEPSSYNEGGGIHCTSHENLELIITPLGGPQDVVAVQVYRDGEVVLAGLGKLHESEKTIYIEEPREAFCSASEWVSYTLWWSEK